MSQSPDQLIFQATQKYQNTDKTRRDAKTIIKQYRSLSPKLEKFVFNDGSEKEMLGLNGTIPVKYKGATYNIPICIWLLDNYPFSSPMVYVKPTPDMLIKSSRHVDQNGKVYLPYLHEWNPTSSDVLGLIQIMIMTFAEMPPVYAKPRNASGSPAHMPTPYPTPQQGGMPMPVSGAASPLPYPTGPANMAPNPTVPYPPYPTQQQQPPYPVYPPTSNPSYPGTTPYPVAGGYPPYPTTPLGAHQATDPVTSPPTTGGTISEEHIRASLISAVSDRVRNRLRDVYGCSQAEVSVLRQQQADLQKGTNKLDGLMQKMEHDQTELDKSLRHLREKEQELKSVLDKLSEVTEPLEIDEAVTTTAPLYKQLLNCYAEDQATQDAIYYLGEALRNDVIDLDTYLKIIRSLSRKQFQLRATMHKCRSKAKLPG